MIFTHVLTIRFFHFLEGNTKMIQLLKEAARIEAEQAEAARIEAKQATEPPTELRTEAPTEAPTNAPTEPPTTAGVEVNLVNKHGSTVLFDAVGSKF